MLKGWRVLDLTDHRGEVGAFLLADLGAEVVKVEPNGGCPSRSSARVAATFDAYNANKSSVELSGDIDADRSLVSELLSGADLVFDSGPPGRLAELGLDRDALRSANPRVVIVTVTPFGLTGPRADQPCTELTIGALGGSVRLQGTPDRAPVQISIPQVWRHAGAEAAVAGLIAHRRMEQTGQPQFVDVSAQSAMTWTMLNAMEAFEVQGRSFERTGSELHLSLRIQLLLEALDGYVVAVPTGRIMQHLLPWMIEDGVVGPEWGDTDWATYDHKVISGERVNHTPDEVTNAVRELCRRYPKWELFRRALTYNATLAPLNTLADLIGFDHLELRSFWSEPEGDGGIRLPGAFLRIDHERPPVRRGTSELGTGSEAWLGELLPPPSPTLADSGPSTSASANATASAAASASVGEGQTLPLSGLKVVDFSWIGVGPITAKALADHGATVVRVESQNRLDGLRDQPPFKDAEPGMNRSNFFGSFNTSKLSIGLDLKTEAGLETARKLMAWADVAIESFTPGTIDRLGLGYEPMSKLNPSLVMVSTSMLGTGSSASTMAGYGYHAAAIAGFQNIVGWPDLPPDGPWLAYTDTIGPRFIVPSVLAALDRRRRTGAGAHVEAAQLEIALQFLSPELARFQADGEPLVRRGNRDVEMAPQGVYPVAGDDQWLAMSIVDDDAWARFVEAMGHPSWAIDPAFASVDVRIERHDEIDAEIARWTANQDGREAERRLAQAGIAAGLVQSSGDLSRDPQYLHRNFYVYLEHSEVGTVPYAGHQYRIEGYDHGPRHAAPCLGEHTFEVLSDLLGLDDDEIGKIAAADALT